MATIRIVRSFASLDVHGYLHGRYRVVWDSDSATAECLSNVSTLAANRRGGAQAAVTRRQIGAREHIAAGTCNCGFFGNFATADLPDNNSVSMNRWTAVAVCLLSGKVRLGSAGARAEYIDVETLYVSLKQATQYPDSVLKLYVRWGARVRIIVTKYLPVMRFEPQLDDAKNVHNISFGSHLMALRRLFGRDQKHFVLAVNGSRALNKISLTVARLALFERDRNVPTYDEAQAIARTLHISMDALLIVDGKRITLKRRGHRRGGIKLTEYQQQLIRDHVPEACAYVKGTRLRIAEGHRGHDILGLMQRIHHSQKTTGQKASVSNLIEKLRNEIGVLA